MGLLHLFDTIVEIMHHDYAGHKDKEGWDRPDYFRGKLEELDKNDQLTRNRFEQIVGDYLLDFQDEHNVLRSILDEAPPTSVGFRVRHYEEYLFVDRVDQESRIQLGTIITEIDKVRINVIADEMRRYLKSTVPEREWWESILLEAKTITIEKDGTKTLVELSHYDNPRQPSNYVVEEKEGTLLFRFNDFIDLNQMKSLLETHKDQLNSTYNWIIDVRECRGGSDSVYHLLLDGIFQPNPTLTHDGMLHLCTERNYHNRMTTFKKFNNILESPDLFIAAFMIQMDVNRGKGFVQFDFSEFNEDNPIKGSELPKRVILVIDKFCGSSGEQFVLDAKQSTKVTVIGRPTKGVLDYSNQAVEIFKHEGYEFVYATSRSNRIDRNEGIDFNGINPDIYIKWTPEHLRKDVDVEYALQLIKNG
ncbi:S41 family peptidase [Bacillus salitolerans]|uniref:S41 family peptidase n=1 Tax=Bacillus salitolerans TaxID=1437434 RepID=A0ABW4LYV0_9BACI